METRERERKGGKGGVEKHLIFGRHRVREGVCGRCFRGEGEEGGDEEGRQCGRRSGEGIEFGVGNERERESMCVCERV